MLRGTGASPVWIEARGIAGRARGTRARLSGTGPPERGAPPSSAVAVERALEGPVDPLRQARAACCTMFCANTRAAST